MDLAVCDVTHFYNKHFEEEKKKKKKSSLAAPLSAFFLIFRE